MDLVDIRLETGVEHRLKLAIVIKDTITTKIQSMDRDIITTYETIKTMRADVLTAAMRTM